MSKRKFHAPSAAAKPRSAFQANWLPGLALVAMVLLAYLPVWRAGFIWDDDRFKGAPWQFPDDDSKVELVERLQARMMEKTSAEWVDAYLANWDVAGLEDDNVLWDPQGQPFRVDQGGTLEFRAQGGSKDFGPVPLEVRTMLEKGGQGRRMVGKVSVEEMRSQAAEVASLTDEWIDEAVDAARFRSKGMRERVRQALKDRRDWMARFAAGDEGIP